METDIEKMYMNLNELLQDICKFLTNDKLRVLLPKEKKITESLINRCKVQLHEISKVQETPASDDYVDMKGTTVLVVKEEEEGGKNNIYSSVDDNVEATLEKPIVCPYKDLPAKDASQNIKDGTIFIRRKFFGFDRMKRVFAAIHYQWLLVYSSDRDLKPMLMFDLNKYQAKVDNERSANFELIRLPSENKKQNKKVYYFMANTRKDMSQWLYTINAIFDKYQKNASEEEDTEEHYDSVDPRLESDNSHDNEDRFTGSTCENAHLISEEIAKRNRQYNVSLKIPCEEMNNDSMRPALPGRPTKCRSIPVAPPIVKPLPLPPEKSDDEKYDDEKSEDKKSEDESSDEEIYCTLNIRDFNNGLTNQKRYHSLPNVDDDQSESDDDKTYGTYTGRRLTEAVKIWKTAVETEATAANDEDKQETEPTNAKPDDEDKSENPVKQAPMLPFKPKKIPPPVAKKPSIIK